MLTNHLSLAQHAAIDCFNAGTKLCSSDTWGELEGEGRSLHKLHRRVYESGDGRMNRSPKTLRV